MRPRVLGQRGAVREGLATNLALVRTLAVVRAHVSGDRRRLGETSITDAALEWLFSGMYAEVRSEVGSLRKRLQAHQALVWFLATVRTHVEPESRQPGV